MLFRYPKEMRGLACWYTINSLIYVCPGYPYEWLQICTKYYVLDNFLPLPASTTWPPKDWQRGGGADGSSFCPYMHKLKIIQFFYKIKGAFHIHPPPQIFLISGFRQFWVDLVNYLCVKNFASLQNFNKDDI